MMYQNGVMPTNKWFEKIKAHVDFKEKKVIDIGCAEGIMSKLAKEAGASNVEAIDIKEEHFQPSGEVHFIHGKIEDNLWLSGDVAILSMIIHWIGKEETLRQIQYQDTVVIIFREPNEGYQVPQNGVWFPTLKELSKTFKGFKLKHTEKLMEQDNGKTIRLAIYEKLL